jgi:hypothetical protein
LILIYIGVIGGDKHWRGAEVLCPDNNIINFGTSLTYGVVEKNSKEEILLCLFRFSNCKIFIFPYLLQTKVKYSCKQLRNIIEDLKDKFNKIDIEFDLSFMEDYTGGFEKMFTYLYIVIKNINNCKALCVLEELYNEQSTSLFISSQIRDIDMSLCNIANQDITIECKHKYNLPIVHQIIDRIDNIYFNLYDLLLGV